MTKLLITLKQKSVKVFKFYITTKFDSFLFDVRNVLIVFYFLCKLGFWPCLNMPEVDFFVKKMSNWYSVFVIMITLYLLYRNSKITNHSLWMKKIRARTELTVFFLWDQ